MLKNLIILLFQLSEFLNELDIFTLLFSFAPCVCGWMSDGSVGFSIPRPSGGCGWDVGIRICSPGGVDTVANVVYCINCK